MNRFSEYVKIRMTPDLKAAIEQYADREGLTVSALLRSTLRKIFQADAVTVEQYRTLIDTPVPYRTEAVPEEA